VAERVERGELKAEEIDDRLISAHLDTADMPDPDLIIRTSGECRLSNFMLWQASYAEMYFPQTMWPDFREEAFAKALEEYSQRERRYGVL
jgi:undecaprenyl diphosphate synthase